MYRGIFRFHNKVPDWVRNNKVSMEVNSIYESEMSASPDGIYRIVKYDPNFQYSSAQIIHNYIVIKQNNNMTNNTSRFTINKNFKNNNCWSVGSLFVIDYTNGSIGLFCQN